MCSLTVQMCRRDVFWVGHRRQDVFIVVMYQSIVLDIMGCHLVVEFRHHFIYCPFIVFMADPGRGVTNKGENFGQTFLSCTKNVGRLVRFRNQNSPFHLRPLFIGVLHFWIVTLKQINLSPLWDKIIYFYADTCSILKRSSYGLIYIATLLTRKGTG